MTDRPRVIAFMVGAPIAEDDPYRAVKLRAVAISDAADAWEDAARSAEVGARADAIGEAAALFGDPAFDPYETGDAARAAGLSEADVDAATYVALVLRLTELGELGG